VLQRLPRARFEIAAKATDEAGEALRKTVVLNLQR
jgi:hypothetical protein